MACSACRALGQTESSAAGAARSPSWLPFVAVGGMAILAGVLWTARDRCPDVYDDYVVAVRTQRDRERAHAVAEGRRMKCAWTAKVRR